ncbi:MAG: hypothetical protein FWG61_08365 [Firmicutes bacterium]|nr:hypothetical protein [Bacillota bacterium]
MNEKNNSPHFGVGGITLLTVLLVLSLTMFAVLTLSSAQADMRLSEKNARAVQEYYIADTKAVSLQAQAAALWPSGQVLPPLDYMQNTLNMNYDLALSTRDNGLMFFCDIPINNKGQTLQLALYLAPPENPVRWRIEQWQFVPPLVEIWDEPVLPVWQEIFN